MTDLIAVLGDITKQDVDAVVNTAHPSLRGTAGGVDRAIHRAGGSAILAECVARYPHGLRPVEAGWTTAGTLPARWVIHVVGPTYTGEQDAHVLEACYRNALHVATSLSALSVAFPLIGAGHNGWSRTTAIAAAIDSIATTNTRVEEVRIVSPDPSLKRQIQAELWARHPAPVHRDTIGALFEREPVRYGLRGDPYLWRELRAYFAETPLPPDWDDLEALIHAAIEYSLNEHTSFSGKPDYAQTVYVAEFNPGHGLSAGSICLPWWAGTAIPILLDRYGAATQHA